MWPSNFNFLIKLLLIKTSNISLLSLTIYVRSLRFQFKSHEWLIKFLSLEQVDGVSVTDYFFINSNSTLSHGARNFYFNLSFARLTAVFFLKCINVVTCTCDQIHFKNLIGITCTHKRERNFRYQTIFICVSSYAAIYFAGVVKEANSPPRNHYGDIF